MTVPDKSSSGRKGTRPIGMRSMSVPLQASDPALVMTSLDVFCGPSFIGGRVMTAAEIVDGCMRRGGTPAMVFPSGADAARIDWPAVSKVALFYHDEMDNEGVAALIDALIQAGVRYVFLSGGQVRGPRMYEAVA